MTMKTIELHTINRWEATFLRHEVNSYFTHGITCTPGTTVLDIGANIGVFSAAVYERLDGNVRIYAFEPIPPLHTTLERNAREFFNGHLTALPYGLASHDANLDFSYIPAATIFSSSSRNQDNIKNEQHRITASLVQMIRQGSLGPLLRHTPTPALTHLINRKLRALRQLETHHAKVRPLSSVLDEQHIDHIDLLKIDVEGAELDVLNGIEERHWPLIRQTVIEVEHWQHNRDTVCEILRTHGFTVSTQQDPIQQAGDIGMIFALKPTPPPAPNTQGSINH